MSDSVPRAPFNAENVTTDEKISFVVTFRYTDWMIRSFFEALFQLSQYGNWDNDDSDTVRELGAKYGLEALEMVREYDRVGQIAAYCVEDNSELPDDILPCDGSTYPKNDYPDLYAVLPVSLKTDDTFATPDLRGHVIGGAGHYTLLTPRSVLERVGEETHIITEAELAAHVHAYDPVVIGDLDVEGVGVPQPNAAQIVPLVTENTYSAGSDQPHNNMQPTVFLIYGIVAK